MATSESIIWFLLFSLSFCSAELSCDGVRYILSAPYESCLRASSLFVTDWEWKGKLWQFHWTRAPFPRVTETLKRIPILAMTTRSSSGYVITRPSTNSMIATFIVECYRTYGKRRTATEIHIDHFRFLHFWSKWMVHCWKVSVMESIVIARSCKMSMRSIAVRVRSMNTPNILKQPWLRVNVLSDYPIHWSIDVTKASIKRSQRSIIRTKNARKKWRVRLANVTHRTYLLILINAA